MRWEKKGQYCLILLITTILFFGSLFFVKERSLFKEFLHQGQAAGDLMTPGPCRVQEPSGLFALNLRNVQGRQQQYLYATLKEMNAAGGDLLGKDSLLVRFPLDQLAKARETFGGVLKPYRPQERLAPSLRGLKSEMSDREMVSSGFLRVNITLFDPEDKVSVAQEVQRLGGNVLRGEDEPGRVLRVELSGSCLEELACLPGVIYIEPVQTVQLLNDRAGDLIGAAPLQITGFIKSPAGLTGAGQFIGLADSGLDRGSLDEIHPDLKSAKGQIPKVVMLKSWAGAQLANDPDGHGTHMAASIAGTGAASQGKLRGIAPGASIYFQGLLDAEGRLDPPPDLTSLFQPAYEAGVRIHVNGWGGKTGGYLAAASQIDRFVRNNPDFLAVFAAGNNGPGEESLTPEAYTKNGLVIGACISPHPVYDPHKVDAGQVCGFSSRGPTEDGRIKPELLAPGALISARPGQNSDGTQIGDLYTYMEGTSMAAAVAGGSAALLREYLIKDENLSKPSAALLKAALVCGAATPTDGPGHLGFGVLDLGNTVLSMREKTLQFVEARDGVEAGKNLSYTYRVKGGNSPLKATLAWTDPDVAPGTPHPLVNNLDLVVRDPAGKEWRGNSFLFPEHPDDVNNLEEVFIPRPEPGTYTIVVKGASISKGVVPGPVNRQDFALVFGQSLEKDVVVSAAEKIKLASGRELRLEQEKVRYVQDGKLRVTPSSGGSYLTGSDIYLPPDGNENPDFAYVVGRTWQGQGVQVVETGSGFLCTEINPQVRTGGYLFSSRGEESLRVNGAPLTDPGSLAPGVEVKGWLNPSTQTLWGAEFSFKETEGLLSGVDLTRQELSLFGESTPIPLSPQAALAYIDELVDADSADLPFGGGSPPGWDKLLPGLKVKLMRSLRGGEVMYVGARRDAVVGTITGVEPETGKISLNTGHTYVVPPGVSLYLDQEEVKLSEIRPGQHALGVLLPGTDEILALNANSSFIYGRIVYSSPKQQVLYLIDGGNNFRILNFGKDTQVFRWGLPAEIAAAEPGNWARIFLDPGTDLIRRVDLAEAGPEQTVLFRSFNSGRSTLETDSGTYRVSGQTHVTKNGYPVAPEDLINGEMVVVTPFLADLPEGPLLAAVAGKTRPGVAVPRLEPEVFRHDSGYAHISGTTSANRLYLYTKGGERRVIPVEGGRFDYSWQTRPDTIGQELVVQIVAVNTLTGGVVGQFLTVPQQVGSVFNDLTNHWAAADVNALCARDLVRGYPDGTFRPGVPVTRAEFTVLLTSALGLPGSDYLLRFRDLGNIPDWARRSVAAAVEHDLIHGYPDGAFQPQRSLTRAEAAVLFDGVLQLRASGFPPETPSLPQQDREQIPTWARQAAEHVFQAGIMRGRTLETFDPKAVMTRAESAAAVNRLLEYMHTGTDAG